MDVTYAPPSPVQACPNAGTGVWTDFLLQSSEDTGHRDWRNDRKNNLQNTAKKPEKPRQPTFLSFS